MGPRGGLSASNPSRLPGDRGSGLPPLTYRLLAPEPWSSRQTGGEVRMYHVIDRDGVQYGPVDLSTAREWLSQLRIESKSLSWRDGESDWMPIGKRSEFQDSGASDFLQSCANPASLPPTPPLLVCPLCCQPDMVKKVSGIYRAGAFNTSQVGVAVGLGVPLSSSGGASSFGLGGIGLSRGTAQSHLSTLLEPPKLPTFSVLDELVVSLGLLSLLGFLCLAAFDFFKYKYSLLGLIFLLIGAVGFVKGVHFIANMHKLNTAKYQRDREHAEAALQRWNALFLCLRDETLFDPDRNLAAPIVNIMDFLHE